MIDKERKKADGVLVVRFCHCTAFYYGCASSAISPGIEFESNSAKGCPYSQMLY